MPRRTCSCPTPCPKSAEFSEDISRQLSQLRESIQRFEAHFRATLALREQQVLGSDRDNLRRYADANRVVGPADASHPRVVFLGDSITDGWRLNQYFVGKEYLNRGISGADHWPNAGPYEATT